MKIDPQRQQYRFCANENSVNHDTTIKATVGGKGAVTEFHYTTSAIIIYLIQCKKCGVQYVGKTLPNRLNGHRSAINTKKDTPVSAQFNQTHPSWEDLKILGIERLCYTGNKGSTRQRRLQCGISLDVHQLRTLQPDGLNQESLEFTRV
ncbi:hypothetical protein Bbelb_002590 [Branchiostoma belcheri]|nr:hypothetical protein Bbelb_002590 [Branchiostoma belcheri]